MRDLTTADLDWNDESAASFDTASLVDRHSAFDGNFRSQRDLRVEGELKGNVLCEGTLFVSEGATIAATVEAEHVTVAGELTGEIRCRGRLQILPSGRERASVSTGSLVIQEGAIYEGQLEMAGVELSALKRLRKLHDMIDVEIGVGIGAGIPPCAGVKADRPHEGAESQLFVLSHTDLVTTARDTLSAKLARSWRWGNHKSGKWQKGRFVVP